VLSTPFVDRATNEKSCVYPYLLGCGLLLDGGRGGLGPIGVHGLLLQVTFKY
jgi:hypothetical protein